MKFNFKNTVLAGITICVSSILWISYKSTAIKNSKIKQLSYYQKAVNTIRNNLDDLESIDRSMIWTDNKYKYGKPPFEILDCGPFYYNNTILEESNADLAAITELWDKGLIEGEFHTIRVFTDSTIIFRVHESDWPLLWVIHTMYFLTENKVNEIEKMNFNVTRVNENCIYVMGASFKYSGLSE